jgi:hypothetical protein
MNQIEQYQSLMVIKKQGRNPALNEPKKLKEMTRKWFPAL